MRKIYALLVLLNYVFIALGYDGQVSVLSVPKSQSNQPDVREIEISWSKEGESSLSVNYRWLGGAYYSYRNSNFALERLGASTKGIMMTGLRVTVDVVDNQSNTIATSTLYFQSSTEEGSSSSSNQVSCSSLSLSIGVDSCQNLFAEGISLSNPRNIDYSFLGTGQVEDQIRAILDYDQVQEYIQKSETAFSEGRINECLDFLERARQIYPTDTEIQERILDAQYGMHILDGDREFVKENYSMALQHYKNALGKIPQRYEAQARIDVLEALEKRISELDFFYRQQIDDAHENITNLKKSIVWEFNEEEEAYYIRLLRYWICYLVSNEAHLQQTNAEAKRDILGDIDARINNIEECSYPECPDFPKAENENDASYQVLYNTALRKLKLYNEEGNEEYKNSARYFINLSLEKNKDFIPAKVYQAYLEPNSVKAMRQMQDVYATDSKNELVSQFYPIIKEKYIHELENAIKNQDLSFIENAVENQVVEDFTIGKYTPFEFAALQESNKSLELLLSADYKNSPDYLSLLRLSAIADKMSCAQLLMEKGADWNLKQNGEKSILELASENKSTAVLNLILNTNTVEPLILNEVLSNAVSMKNQVSAKILLEHKANINLLNEKGDNLFMQALKNEDEEMAFIMLDHDINFNQTNQDGETALEIASVHKLNKVLDRVIEKSSESIAFTLNHVKNKNPEAARNLGIAVAENGLSRNSAYLVELAQKNVADLYKVKNKDQAPFILRSIAEGKSDIFKQLINTSTFDIDENLDDNYISIECAKHNRVDELLFILKRNPNLSIQDSKGRTALHYAAESGYSSIAKILIENGCNKEIKDKKGKKAARLAKSSGHKELDKFLRAN